MVVKKKKSIEKTLKMKQRCQGGEKEPRAAMFPDESCTVLIFVRGHPQSNIFAEPNRVNSYCLHQMHH